MCRAAIVNLVIIVCGYKISSGIFPTYLYAGSIVALAVAKNEQMRIGYILNKGQALSELGVTYTDALRQYRV